MARPLSQAEKWRAHGEAFRLALELGCTPREAEAKIAGIAAHERHRAAADRLAAKMNAPLAPAGFGPGSDDGERDPQPWMMRD